MKKTIAVLLVIICLLSINTVHANDTDILAGKAENEITETRDKMEMKKAEYTEKYKGEEYWFAGYIIEEIVQPYSIPLCFLGIAIGLVFQYLLLFFLLLILSSPYYICICWFSATNTFFSNVFLFEWHTSRVCTC